jgi:hypothetical protein
MRSARFVANTAVRPLIPDLSGLYGREANNGSALGQPCSAAGGGGICVVGQANSTVSLQGGYFAANVAQDGAGLYMAPGLNCIQQRGCYSVRLDSVLAVGAYGGAAGCVAKLWIRACTRSV